MAIVESLQDFRKKNGNPDFTLIARDCIGGILYHQLGLRFLSPTINLFFTPSDFNEFCLHLKEYIKAGIGNAKLKDIPYPVGVLSPKNLKPVFVHFMHYRSFTEAKAKWIERKKRINWDNLYVVSSLCYEPEKKELSDKLIGDWNKISYKKVILVDRKYGFDDEFAIERPKECKEFAWMLFSPNGEREWERTFNEYDFIEFLNGGSASS